MNTENNNVENNELTEDQAKELFSQMHNSITSGSNVSLKLESEPNPEAKTPEEEPKVEETKEPVEAPKPEEVSTSAKPEEAKTTDVKEVEKKPEQNPAPPNDGDLSWVNGLSDEAKEKVQALIDSQRRDREEANLARQQWKSNAGRISAYQRSIAELKTQLATRPLHQEIPAAKLEKTDDFNKLAEQDPKFAAFLENYVQKAVDSAVSNTAKAVDNRLRSTLEPMLNGAAMDYQAEQQAVLEQLVPNIREVVNSDAFKSWVDYQRQTGNEKVLSLVGSENAYEVERGMRLFDQDYRDYLARTGQLPKEEPAKASTETQEAKTVPSTVTTVDTSKADAIEKARQQKGGAAALTTTSLPSPKAGKDEVLDPVALFEQIYKQSHPTLDRTKK